SSVVSGVWGRRCVGERRLFSSVASEVQSRPCVSRRAEGLYRFLACKGGPPRHFTAAGEPLASSPALGARSRGRGVLEVARHHVGQRRGRRRSAIGGCWSPCPWGWCDQCVGEVRGCHGSVGFAGPPRQPERVRGREPSWSARGRATVRLRRSRPR